MFLFVLYQYFYIKNINIEPKGMSQWLRVHIALTDDLYQAPTNALTPAPGASVPARF